MLQDASEQEAAAKRARQEYTMESHATSTSTTPAQAYGSVVPGVSITYFCVINSV